MKKINKDGSPVVVKRDGTGFRYLKGQDRAKVITYLKERIRAYSGKWQGFEAHRDKTVFEIGFFAGLRVEEMYHLDMEDVCNAERLPHEIEIRDEIPIIGKGNVYRIVPVCKPLRTALEEFIRAKRKGGVESLAPDAPLFHSFSGKRLAYRSLQSVVERRCYYAGLTEAVKGRIKSRYSIHDLRHTFAILWLGEHDYLAPAEAYKKLGQLMGHSDIQTTQKYTLYDVREAA